jgi:hypothetical protein
MSNNSDTEDEIEKKKEPNFFTSLLKNTISLLIFMIIGIAILYNCKVAAGGLMPTNLDNCKLAVSKMQTEIDNGDGTKTPNVTYKTNVGCGNKKPVTTNINIAYQDEMYYSAKLDFNYNDNVNSLMNSGILKFLMELTNGPKSNNYTYYFGKILENIIFTNFAIFDKLYKTLNSISTTPFSETCIIFLTPYIFPIILPFFIFINVFLFIFGWFYYLSLFWSKKTPAEQGEVPQVVEWKDEKTNWWIILYVFIAFCLMFIPMMGGPIIGIIIVIYVNIFPLFATGHVKGTPQDKKYGIRDFLMDTLKFKKNVIMYIFSYLLIIGAYNSNGSHGAAVAITAFLVILIIWFFDKMFGIFTPYKWTAKDAMTAMSGVGSSNESQVLPEKPIHQPQGAPSQSEKPIHNNVPDSSKFSIPQG